MSATLLSMIVAARWLSKHDYATIRQTFLAYEFAAPLLMLGLPNALYYFLPREKEIKRGVILDNMTLLVAMGLVFSLFIALGGHQLLAMRFDNPDLRQTLSWLIPYPLIIMPIAGFAAVMVSADRTKTLAIYNVLSSLVLAVVSITTVVTTQSYEAPILARILVPSLFLPVALILMLKAIPGPLRFPNWASMREMLVYSVPLGLASMLGSITLQLHAVIVAALCTPEDFAVYINGAIEIPLISIVTGSITTVVFAEMAELCSRGDKAGALKLFHTASIKSACILFPTMCFLLATADQFIVLLFSEKYTASVTPFVIYLFMLPARIVVYGSALMALGMTKVILFRSIFDLVINCILCFFLVKLIGFIGASIGTILTIYLWTIPFNLHKIRHGFGIRLKNVLPFFDLYKMLSISTICIPLSLVWIYAFPHIPSILGILISALTYGAAVAYLFYRFKYFFFPYIIERRIPQWLKA